MAEPTGDYRLSAAIDLSPLGGKLALDRTVHIERPPPDVLERRLAEFAGKDSDARWPATEALYWFSAKPDVRRIVAAMVATLDGVDEWGRRLALCVLSSHTHSGEVAPHADRILRVLTDGKRSSPRERALAAKVLSYAAPKHPGLAAALEKARKDSDPGVRRAAGKALRRCADR